MKPNRKLRKPSATSKLVLEEVIGLTTRDAQGLASNVNTPYCVYPAGCVAVVYDAVSGTKSHLLVSHRPPKPLRCVTVSLDGRFIGTGELGHQPAVLVWDSAAQTCMAELKGHQYGVSCIAFSPDGKLLVSVGYPRDGQLCLWEWRSGTLVAKLKACSSCSAISSVSFSADGKSVVTAGRRHLKTWSIRHARALSKTRTPYHAMTGTPVNLGCLKGFSFVSVVSMNMTYGDLVASDRSISSFPLYALTETGVLCVIQSGNSISQEVDLMVEKGFGLSASGNLLACACSSGTVRLFHIDNLSHAANLHHSEAISCPDSNGVAYLKRSSMDTQLVASQPDAVACVFLTSEKLAVVYSDNSLYIWDIHDVFKATRCCVLVAHGACIMDIKTLPCEHMHDPSIACVSRGCSGGVSFATCSADGIIRLWDLAFERLLMDDANQKLALNESPGTISVSAACLVSAGIFERDIVESGVGIQGFRSMAVSSDGKYLAAGDCQGNLYIYDLHTYDYTCLQGAHDAEILSLSFSLPWKIDSTSKEELNNLYFLASGGRDGAIHIFDANRSFKLIASINDHSASVTALKLSSSGCHILSCSADRSLVLRDVILTDNSCQILHRHCLKASDGTIYDMATDPNLEIVATAGQDKKIKKFNLATGKLLKLFKQDGDYGDPIKVAVDPSCSYLVCSYSNKSICMYDFATGEKVAAAMGHGELITGVTFLPDCRHIISVGGDGCIFFWRVPSPFASRMRQKMNESSGWLSPESTMLPIPSSFTKFQEQNYNGHESHIKDISSPGSSREACHRLHNKDWSPKVMSTFKYSFSKLPKWAQSKVTDAVAVQRDKVSACQQPELNNTSTMTVSDSGNDTLCSRAEIPSQQDSYNCEPCPSSPEYNDSPASPLSACHRSTIGSHWRMIHTVCLDLLSPEVWSLNEAKVQLPCANLLQTPTSKMLHDVEVKNVSLENPPKFMKSSTQYVTQYEQGLNNHTKCYDFCLPDNVMEQATDHTAFKCHHAPEQMLTKEKDCPSSTAMDTEVCDVVLQDDSLFNQHFGNLSVTLEEKRPSAKRSYSARFTLRRDRLRSNLRDDLSSHLSARNLPAQNLVNSTRPNLGLTRDSPSTSFAVNNFCVEAGVITDQEYVHMENSMIESIFTCKEALANLDAAAKITFQSFSELNRMATAEERPECAAHLYEEAVDMLPIIAKTVEAITQMVHSKMIMLNGAEPKD